MQTTTIIINHDLPQREIIYRWLNETVVVTRWKRMDECTVMALLTGRFETGDIAFAIRQQGYNDFLKVTEVPDPDEEV